MCLSARMEPSTGALDYSVLLTGHDKDKSKAIAIDIRRPSVAGFSQSFELSHHAGRS